MEHIALELEGRDILHLDLTLSKSERQAPVHLQGDLAMLGIPVYGHRVPALAAKRMQQIQARGMLAVVVVICGNLAYEDALLEITDLDASDREQTRGFGGRSRELLLAADPVRKLHSAHSLRQDGAFHTSSCLVGQCPKAIFRRKVTGFA
ncbi:MAG: hypothetical protein ACLFPG_04570 [Desulfohalobiaceae bacterium]